MCVLRGRVFGRLFSHVSTRAAKADSEHRSRGALIDRERTPNEAENERRSNGDRTPIERVPVDQTNVTGHRGRARLRETNERRGRAALRRFAHARVQASEDTAFRAGPRRVQSNSKVEKSRVYQPNLNQQHTSNDNGHDATNSRHFNNNQARSDRNPEQRNAKALKRRRAWPPAEAPPASAP